MYYEWFKNKLKDKENNNMTNDYFKTTGGQQFLARVQTFMRQVPESLDNIANGLDRLSERLDRIAKISEIASPGSVLEGGMAETESQVTMPPFEKKVDEALHREEDGEAEIAIPFSGGAVNVVRKEDEDDEEDEDDDDENS